MKQPILKVAISDQLFGQRSAVPNQSVRHSTDLKQESFNETPFGNQCFYRLNGNIDYKDFDLILEYCFRPSSMSNPPSLDTFDPMLEHSRRREAVEENCLSVPHFSKMTQQQLIREYFLTYTGAHLLDTMVGENWIFPKTIALSYTKDHVEWNGFEGTDKPVILKPEFGSTGVGIHYFKDGINLDQLKSFMCVLGSKLPDSTKTEQVRELLIAMGLPIPGWLNRKDSVQLSDSHFTYGGAYKYMVVQEKLDIVEEYRLILTHGGMILLDRAIEDDGALPMGNEYGERSYIAIVREDHSQHHLWGDVKQFPYWVISMSLVLKDMLRISPILSFDLFKTRDGKVGVLEFQPEYSLSGSGIPNQVIQWFYYAMAYHTKERLNWVKTNYDLNLKPLLEENHE